MTKKFQTSGARLPNLVGGALVDRDSRLCNETSMPELLEARIAPATFTVTSLGDAGAGSLRDAIAQANANPGPDLIVFKKGLEGAISMISGQMQITDTLTIKGPGADKLAVDGNLASRIFVVTDANPQKDSPLTVSGLTFLRGLPGGQDSGGGAILSTESLNVRACAFLENRSNGMGATNFNGGGAIFVANVPQGALPIDVDIRDSLFALNRAVSGAGGAVRVDVLGTVKLINNGFTNNDAQDAGGGVDLRAGIDETILIQDCRFVENKAAQAGAASLRGSSQGDGEMIVRGSTFIGNFTTNGDAGALGVIGGKILVEKSSFIQNTAVGEGGALDAKDYASLTIRSSQFLDNTALQGGLETGGGGIGLEMPDGAITRVIASIIGGNDASAGGGIIVKGGSGRLEITGSKILNNSAAENGGGILVSQTADTDLNIVRSKIIGNAVESSSANQGGGGVFFSGDGKFTMQHSHVVDNSAGRVGGGILLFNIVEEATITGSLLAKNYAFGAGGGVWTNGPIELRGTKLLANYADVGGGMLGTKKIELNSCLIAENLAGGGGGLVHTTGLEPTLNRTKIVRNISSDGLQISEV